jgi:tetratricopeptide (TPR) repeat protein
MLNVQLGVSAVLAELAAWSVPAMLHSHADAALVSYLCTHAVASVLVSLFALPLLTGEQARPRSAVLALLAAFSYAIPVLGFVGVMAWVLVLRFYRAPSSQSEFESLQLPEFDLHQRMQGSFRQAGLRSFLSNSEVPMNSRMRAMVALQHVSGRVSSPLLRNVLNDPSEDLRLLAYGMLDTLEQRISRNIDQTLKMLRQAQADEGMQPLGPQGLLAAQGLSDLYWELVYQDLAQGDLRTHAIQESLRYCELVLQQQPDNVQLNLRHGRLLHALGRLDEAAAAYYKAQSLGLPVTSILPYVAELCFELRDFEQVRDVMSQMDQWSVLPRLRPIIDYWSAR